MLIPTTTALSAASTSASSGAAGAGSSSSAVLAEHEGSTCPICLSPPTAPRMTKCGHVYCYACMLHYLTVGEDTGTVNFSRPAQPEIGGGSYNRPGALPRASQGGGSTSHAGSGANTPGSAAQVQARQQNSAPQPKKWRRCPVCWDAVYARDLKAVRWWDPNEEAKRWAPHPHREPASSDPAVEHADAGLVARSDYLSMRLVERPQITTLALPQSDTWPGGEEDDFLPPHSAPWHFQPDALPFAKFMLATPDLIEQSLNEDLSGLEAERIETEQMPGGRDEASLIFIAAAKEKVLEQITKIKVECDTPAVRSMIDRKQRQMKAKAEEAEERRERLATLQQPSEQPAHAPVQQIPVPPAALQSEDEGEASAAEPSAPEHSTDEHEDSGVADFLAHRSQLQGGQTPRADVQNQATPRRDPKPRRNLNPPSPSSSSYFYYQAASGQNIFLHPLDIKVLHSRFGTYASFPRTIHVRVSGADEGSMNEDLRRRCKYLTHIPTAADVVFIEVDWEAVNAEGPEGKLLQMSGQVLRPYLGAMRQRKNKRRDKGRREDRAKLKADEEAALSTLRQKPAQAPSAEYKEFMFQQWRAGEAGSLGSNNGALSSSMGSNGSSTAAMATMAAIQQAHSPSFREAALVGGEREYPIHPGGPLEEFPAVPGVSQDGASGRGAVSIPGRKTVWGTTAPARTAFTESLRRGGRGSDDEVWERDVDDAWLELEEDFLLGATPGGRRNTGAVKESKGLNKQPPSGAATPRTHSYGAAGLGSSPPKKADTAQAPRPKISVPTAASEGPSGASGAEDVDASATAAAAASRKPKKAKKKLVLTSGGRGTA